VYPIKVNQQRLVVEEVYGYGREFGFGLEVGSKPELLAVMALTEGESERMIVCNGFKDDSYIEAVILATKLGRTIIPVVENFSELGLILKHARAYDVRPRIGVRVKLASEGAGRWRESSGEKSKFGLFVSEIIDLFRVLREAGMEDCLQLVHCHPGSQLQDIRRVKDAVNELAHVYAELKLMGAGLRYIDVGGGLGVDYDGSRTNYASSMNYTLAEYASDVVYRIASVCNARGIEHPVIVSESGRAIAAHHSVLVFDALGSSALDRFAVSEQDARGLEGAGSVPQPVADLRDAYRSITERRLVECYHDAQQSREQALQMFNLGYLSLEHRGLVERLYWATCAKIRDYCRRLESVPEELEGLESILSDIYFCNVSVFQSLPDSWAIDQLFPIMPIHRLDERPTRNAVLADITCDSDGKIDRFVSLRETKRTLELHELHGRAVLPRRVHGRRLPGDARRPAQPVRRHARRAHQAARGRRLVDRGDRQGRHGRRGAALHALRRRPPAAAARARLRARRARGPPVAVREPGAAAFLRRGAERLHVPRAGLSRVAAVVGSLAAI
jgi:arginine decarboxylase